MLADPPRAGKGAGVASGTVGRGAALAISDTAVACWVAVGGGLAMAAVCWGAVVAGRAARRQRDQGRGRAAVLTTALGAVWLIGGLALLTLAIGWLLPR